MNITAEAIEAAAKASFEQGGFLKWDDATDTLRERHHDLVRPILEAAHPFLADAFANPADAKFPQGERRNQVIPVDAVDPVVAYLNAHFRPDVAAELLAAAQPLMAIAWDEGVKVERRWRVNAERGRDVAEPRNPYRAIS